MKKIFLITGLFLAVFSLLAPASTYARAIGEDINLAEEKAMTSYAVGMLMGSNLQSLMIEVDYEAYLEGFKASLENTETKISMNEAMEIADLAIQRAEEKASEEQRLIQEEFLTNNSIKPGVRVTPSGLQYEIISEGEDGARPAANSVVKVNYTGRLIDGTVFDKSDEEGAFIPLEMVIPGWAEGLQLMTVGSSYILYLPANLAYGKNGIRGIIPQYATLVFDVELLEIAESPSQADGDYAEDALDF